MIALRTTAIAKHFGALAALDGVDLAIPRGARHALIGPNGAGKTTLINVLTGALAATSGEVFLGEDRVTGLAQHARARRGLTRTYQVTSLFPNLTVLESVALAMLERDGLAGGWWRPVASHRAQLDEARALLATLRLEADADRRTASLAYGRQRLVEIALGLASRPKILLLDEPAAGIPADESRELLGVVSRLPADVTVLFIEHDMGLVFRFAERITVLAAGRVLAEGTPAEIAADERVRAVYLGARFDG